MMILYFGTFWVKLPMAIGRIHFLIKMRTSLLLIGGSVSSYKTAKRLEIVSLSLLLIASFRFLGLALTCVARAKAAAEKDAKRMELYEQSPGLNSLSNGCISDFKQLKQFHSISFEGDSGLMRIESFAFSSSSLRSIVIPCSVDILGLFPFSFGESLSSISFESPSHFKRLESSAFAFSSVQSIVIPCSVEILGS
jgi:hypothetical protein